MSKTIKCDSERTFNIDLANDLFPNHYCALRLRNHTRNDIERALADAICHRARHGEINEQFIAYATDSKSLRLYGFRTDESYLLVLQKDFHTQASLLADQNTFMTEFEKAIACYHLSRRFGGRIFSLDNTNAVNVGHLFASAIIYKINGQRCGL